MELTLYTETFFDAAHFLRNYEGKCASLHGHTWKLCIWVKGEESQLDERDILWDFTNAKLMASRYDHKNLNEVMEGNPTAERLVIETLGTLKKDRPELRFKVRVYESLASKSSYCEGGDF